MKVVLASASERRLELLARLVKEFTVIVSDFDESKVIVKSSIEKYVEDIATGKAEAVAENIDFDAIIIAADTIVSIDKEILGRPNNEDDAFNMFSRFSGNTHKVYTSLVVINTKTGKVIKSTEATEVKFSKLTESEITEYIQSEEPLDKAGAYGIQGIGGAFVEELRGCYYNVVGLSLNRLRKILLEIK